MHVMIDLETLGLRPDALILQIGAVAFEPRSGGRIEMAKPFNVHIRAQDGAGTMDHGTFVWWLGRGEAARERLRAGLASDSCMLVHEALLSLAQWPDLILGLPNGWDGIEGVWSQGAAFDLSILASAYARVLGGPPPWNYRAQRDTRTLYWASSGDGSPPEVDLAGVVEHDAFDDAVVQAQQVQIAMGRIRIRSDQG